MKKVLLVLGGFLLMVCVVFAAGVAWLAFSGPGEIPRREEAQGPAGPCASGGMPTGGAPATALPGDEPMERGDAAGTGHLAGPGPAGSPVLRWCFDTGQSVSGAPVVDRGVLYVASGSEGRSPGVLYAIEAASGRERWRVGLADSERLSPPAISEGAVYVCANVPQGDDEKALLGIAASEPGALHALDAETGRERWRFPVPDDVNGENACSAPIVDGGVVYFFKNDRVFAVAARTGELQWQKPFESTWRLTQPAVADGTVYVDGFSEVAALSAATGVVRWRVKFDVYTYGGIGPPTVANGIVYVVVDEDPTVLYALDASTGAERWHTESRSGILSRPAVADGVVYVETNVDLYALDAATGKRRWRLEARGVGHVVVADGVAYFRYGSTLHAVDAATGEDRWKMVVGAASGPGMSWVSPPGQPMVAGGSVYVAGDRHYLYAIGGTEQAISP